MRYIFTSGQEDGIADLTLRLAGELKNGKKVLWLVSGGSNIHAEVKIMDSINADLTSNLKIMPIDERYGPVGHADSNLQQLFEAGFEPAEAEIVPVLRSTLKLEDTAYYYDKVVHKLFEEADFIVAQLGIGEDGHIAGILPGTIATKTRDRWAVGYDSNPYQRLSLTFPALKKVDAAYVFAFGKMKLRALENLRDMKLPLSKNPAQILKLIPETYLYNDQIGDK